MRALSRLTFCMIKTHREESSCAGTVYSPVALPLTIAWEHLPIRIWFSKNVLTSKKGVSPGSLPVSAGIETPSCKSAAYRSRARRLSRAEH